MNVQELREILEFYNADSEVLIDGLPLITVDREEHYNRPKGSFRWENKEVAILRSQVAE